MLDNTVKSDMKYQHVIMSYITELSLTCHHLCPCPCLCLFLYRYHQVPSAPHRISQLRLFRKHSKRGKELGLGWVLMIEATIDNELWYVSKEMLVKRSQDERKGEVCVRAYVSELHYMVQGNGKGNGLSETTWLHVPFFSLKILSFYSCTLSRWSNRFWNLEHVRTFYGYNPSVVFHINLKEWKQQNGVREWWRKEYENYWQRKRRGGEWRWEQMRRKEIKGQKKEFRKKANE